MTPWKGMSTCAVMLLAAGASPIQAAWCNVFEVCCPRHCQKPPPAVVSHYYAPPTTCCASPCPQPQPCCQEYVARSYCVPETTYQSRSYYEKVVTQHTSYYYEPVTTYRQSYYYDPCSCNYIARSCPVVHNELRAKVCPVESWVQRCTQVPVTTYRQAFYWEPVHACPPPCPSPCGTQPGVSIGPGGAPPGVSIGPGGTQPGVSITPGGAAGDQPGVRIYSPEGYRPPPSDRGTDSQMSAPKGVQLERVVALPSAKPNVEGQVVAADYTPRADTEVVFVLADRKAPEERLTTNKDGEFRATLAEGHWDVYVKHQGGPAVLQKRIEVGPKAQTVTLLSK